jgi:hypothetical protein
MRFMNESEIEIDDPVVVINIRQQFPYVQNAQDLYNCTRGMWRMNPKRAGRAKYFLAVYQGVIKEIYEVHDCIPATLETKEYWRKRLLSQGRHVADEGRAEFRGQVASDDVRNKYVGRRVPVRLTENPVRYFNC